MNPELRLSVLDTAPITHGSSAGTALRESVELARLADDLGYHRYWLPEHHGMSGVASAAPAVVGARIASVTRRIRVGAGGVMLPNHPPIVVAEQCGTLEALHPGRIDLGLGRALGGPRSVTDRLRGERTTPFEAQVRELLELFDAEDGRAPAVPAAGNRPEIWLLGSGDHTAEMAGRLGLPFAAAHHLAPLNTAAATYRQAFVPSVLCPAPRVAVSVAAIVAESDERAHWLAGPLRMKVARRREGRPIRLMSPEIAAAQGPDTEPDGVFVGAADTVLPQLRALAEQTGAGELIVKTDIYDPADRRRSYELLIGGHADGRLVP
ncbi:LLM class flavin-dependent oxidoreductase [Nocardia sp. NPDC050697]|uniref:LLM class flavin-dependent oxidoreductase n=1 Tax=Nocardia sp. NPDC050697 TaxID=3155158 RepID=UPI0033C1E862